MGRRPSRCTNSLIRYIARTLALTLLLACSPNVPAVAAGSAFASQPAAQTYAPAALWVWQERVITDAHAQAAFFTFAQSHNVRRIYIECESAVQHDQPALIGFLQTAAAGGMTTELLFGDARWVFPGSGYPHQGYAIGLVTQYTAQLLGSMTTGKPVAVHFDVEPYSLPQWKTERNTVALDYIGLVTQLAGAAHELGLTLSVDVPYWYSTIPVTMGSVTTPMNQLVIDAVDTYVIMDYWDTTPRVERQAVTDLEYADGIAGKQVVIGALTSCNQHPPETSFCNPTHHSGTAVMEKVLTTLAAAEAPNAAFAGLAIEDYAGFRILGP